MLDNPVNRRVMIAIIGSSLAALLALVIITLAEDQIIFITYFTPTKIVFSGLKEQYPVNGSITYSISLKGYGSNCITFTSQVLRVDSASPAGHERMAFFNRIDDCRKIIVLTGPYNYTQNFSYSGHSVLGSTGEYKVQVDVFDEVTRTNSSDMRVFKVD